MQIQWPRVGAVVLASLAGITDANAQETAPPAEVEAEPSSGGQGLEEIVVTAQRREENLQDVPIAVTSVTAETALRLGINDPQSVAQIVPGLTLNRSSMTVIPFLRGVGSNFGTPGFEPSVAIFVDDVYQPTGAGAIFDFNSIASIEVLKGPQGTLFGRNATGGVLHIRTREPEFEPVAEMSVGYANYDTISGQIYASTGITDNVAVNLSAYGRNQADGWGENILTGEDAYDGWSYGARARLLFQAGDRSSILIGANYEKSRSGQGQGQRPYPGTYGLGLFDGDGAGAGYYDSTVNYGAWFTNSLRQVNARIRHDFDDVSLVSITAYGEVKSDSLNDADGTPIRFIDAHTRHAVKTFTQEVQLLADESAPVQWILGAFYLHDVSTYDSTFEGQAFGSLVGEVGTRQTSWSIAGFGQATVELLPRTNLTLGLRYTSDHRRFVGSNAIGPVENGPLRDRVSWSAITGRASIDYSFTPDIMGYVAFNHGFKSGVFNLSGLSPGQTSLQPAANPETLDAYTVGLKSELFGRRLRMNLEGYYYDYRNIQVFESVPSGTGTLITNGGGARILGLEADFSAVPVENLTINLNLALADGEYTRFDRGPVFFPLPPNATIPIPPGCAATVPTYPSGPAGAPVAQRFCDLAGNDTIQTPTFASNLSAVYAVPISFGSVELAGSWAHTSSYFFEPDNNPELKQRPMDIVNASIALLTLDERFGLRFWGRNLTGERYVNSLVQNGSFYNKFSAAAPRTYGVTFTARFGGR